MTKFFLLDTNACIDVMNGSYPNLIRKLHEQEVRNIGISSIVQAELYFGAFKSRAREKNLAAIREFLSPFRILPFGEPESLRYGELRADLETQDKPIGPNDMLIAATALVLNAVVITRDLSEFSRVPGLQIEDWTQ